MSSACFHACIPLPFASCPIAATSVRKNVSTFLSREPIQNVQFAPDSSRCCMCPAACPCVSSLQLRLRLRPQRPRLQRRRSTARRARPVHVSQAMPRCAGSILRPRRRVFIRAILSRIDGLCAAVRQKGCPRRSCRPAAGVADGGAGHLRLYHPGFGQAHPRGVCGTAS
jgi:hypothetical protein